MSHGIKIGQDTVFTVREPAWHRLGVVLEKPLTSVEEVLKVTGLDWTVSMRPMLYATGAQRGRKYEEVPNRFVVVRDSDNQILGQVSDRYTPVQNVDAFRFLDNLLGGEMQAESGGSLGGGTRVWLMCRLPDHIEIGGSETMQFVFISTSHDGRQAVIAAPTNIVIVCMNTLTWAISDAQGGGRAYSVRHLGDAAQSLVEAREAMKLTVDYNKVFKKLGDKLATKKVAERTTAKILGELYGLGEKTGDREVKNAKGIIGRITAITYGKGADLGLEDTTPPNAVGTGWALANAIAEQQDHYGKTRAEDSVGAATAIFTRQVDDPDRMKAKGMLAVADALGVSVTALLSNN